MYVCLCVCAYICAECACVCVYARSLARWKSQWHRFSREKLLSVPPHAFLCSVLPSPSVGGSGGNGGLVSLRNNARARVCVCMYSWVVLELDWVSHTHTHARVILGFKGGLGRGCFEVGVFPVPAEYMSSYNTVRRVSSVFYGRPRLSCF